MHEPTRIAAPRPAGESEHFVVCGACAQRGRGHQVRIGEQDYSGVLYGPVSEALAESLIEAHRQASGHAATESENGG